MSETDERSRSGDDDSTPLQADKGDQQPDARADGVLQGRRNRIDEVLAYANRRKHNESEARETICSQRRLPWDS